MRLAYATVVAMTIASATAVGATKEQLDKAEMLSGPVRLWSQFQSRVTELSERFPLALISPASERTITSTLGELPRPDAKLSMHPSDADARGGARPHHHP